MTNTNEVKSIKHEGFTPGPWCFDTQSEDTTIRLYACGVTIARLTGAIDRNQVSETAFRDKCNEAQANARLIADAPRLAQREVELMAMVNALAEALKDLLAEDMEGMPQSEIAKIEEDSLFGECLHVLKKAEKVQS